MHFAFQYDGSRRAKSLPVTLLRRPQFADLGPIYQVCALRDTDGPAARCIGRREIGGERWQRKIHQVSPAKTDHAGVFRKGPFKPRGIRPLEERGQRRGWRRRFNRIRNSGQKQAGQQWENLFCVHCVIRPDAQAVG